MYAGGPAALRCSRRLNHARRRPGEKHRIGGCNPFISLLQLCCPAKDSRDAACSYSRAKALDMCNLVSCECCRD